MSGDRELNELVARVTAEVLKEVEFGEAAAFKVSDLRNELESLGGGGGSAWKVTYDTSSGHRVRSVGNKALAQGPAAWKITYDTSDRSVSENSQS